MDRKYADSRCIDTVGERENILHAYAPSDVCT